jgi:glycosyltransferase 2 family protein
VNLDPRTVVRRLLVAMMLGVALYAGFVVYRGVEVIGAALATFRWSAFALALALVLLNYFLRFWRWELYLARLGIRGIPKIDSFFTFFSGFVLTVTPGKVGEVFKSLVLFETHGVPAANTAPIVIAERLTDVIGVVVLVIIGSTAFPGGAMWGGAGALAVIVGLTIIASKPLSERLLGLLERSPGKLGALAPRVRLAWENLRSLTTPTALFFPTLLACVSWALEGSALYVILRGFGTSPAPALALFAYATSILAGALIPVPGGLGVTEGLLEQQLHHLGNVPLNAATSAMILARFATLWFAVLLGFLALAVLRRKFPTLLSAKPAPTESPTPADPAAATLEKGQAS